MRKSDRKMIANMFGTLVRLILCSLQEDGEYNEEELRDIRDEIRNMIKEIEVWREED